MNKIPVLKIRDENGNFIPINAIRGDRGKSAYEQAVEGGYKGTEEEFIAILNGLTNTDNGDNAHYSDFLNPHRVTKEQLGLGNVDNLSLNEHLMDNLLHNRATTSSNVKGGALGTNASSPNGGGAIGVSASEADGGGAVGYQATTGSGGAVGCEAYSENGGAVGYLANAYGGGGCVGAFTSANVGGGAVGFQAYADFGGAVGANAKTGGGFAGGNSAQTVDNSGNPIDAIQLGSGRNSLSYTLQVYDYLMMDANGKIPTGRLPFASGSYKGTGTSGNGTNAISILTFGFVPRLVIVSCVGGTNVINGNGFIWIRGDVTEYNPNGLDTTITLTNSGTSYQPTVTHQNEALYWYGNSAAQQLNTSGTIYNYVAFG